MPVINHMRAHLRGADRIFVDETRAPALDPGRNATKSGFFWAVVSDDRGHGGVGPPTPACRNRRPHLVKVGIGPVPHRVACPVVIAAEGIVIHD